MKKQIQNIVLKAADLIEAFIGILLAISISIVVVYLIIDLKLIVTSPNTMETFEAFMASAFSLIIGIEFIKMLCKHTPGTAIEVLLFAIARQLIVEHTSTFENLIGILSIAVLFAIRKYLLYNFDEVEKTIYRGSEEAKKINLLEHINIPCEEDETLEEVIINELEKKDKTIGTGTCVYFSNFALRIAKIRENVITRVEVIKSKN